MRACELPMHALALLQSVRRAGLACQRGPSVELLACVWVPAWHPHVFVHLPGTLMCPPASARGMASCAQAAQCARGVLGCLLPTHGNCPLHIHSARASVAAQGRCPFQPGSTALEHGTCSA